VNGDGKSSLSRLAQELLVAERAAVEPAQLQARAAERARRLMASHPSETGELSVSRVRIFGARSRAARFALVMAAALAVAGLAGAGMSLRGMLETAEPTPRIMPTTLPREVPTTLVRPSPAGAVSAAASQSAPIESPAPPTSATRAAPRSPSASQYAIELELLEPARRGIARHDYVSALSAIARHSREFPNGQLAEERSALKVRALWGLGRTAEAEAASASFRLRYPRSALLGGLHKPSTH
jgi:hypothetical protein